MQVFCMNYWYIFGQERPTHEEPHGRYGLFTPTRFWLVRLFQQCQLYIRTAYTWSWLVWPNAGLLHELLVYFLARKCQHKKSYMDFMVFLPLHDSGLCVCSTSDSCILENPIHDSGLRGQMQVFCINYWYNFWPGKANTTTATWTFWSLYAYMILACAPVLPVPAIYKNSLYIILACVAKCRSSAWIIGIFLARKGQHKKSYMDVMVFLPLHDSGLCACSSASYI